MSGRETEDKEVLLPVNRVVSMTPLRLLALAALLLVASSCAPHRRGRLPAEDAPERTPAVRTSPARTKTPEPADKTTTRPGVSGKSTAELGGVAKGDIVCREALKHVGTMYVYGGSTPRGFDCSGLVQYCYRKVDVKLPRRAIDQSRSGKGIRLAQARRGDLIFFATQGGDRITHVGIYLGDEKFIHAPRKGKSIEVQSLEKSSWYRKRIKRVRRVLAG